MIDKYLIAIFNVVVGLVTSERIAICACIVFGVQLVWTLLALLFSFQSKFAKNCKNISMFVEEKGLNSDTYPKFIELASKLPDSFLRSWKTFEHAEKGLPSEFIKRAECLDAELSGGLFKQNRSVMKGYIGFFTTIFALLSLALVGSSEPLTGYAFAEALVVPFFFTLLSMLIYFLYAAIRQYQYRMCVEDFNEMLDILNEKVEYNEIDFNATNVNNSLFIKKVVDPAVDSLKPVVMVNEEIGDNNHVDNLEVEQKNQENSSSIEAKNVEENTEKPKNNNVKKQRFVFDDKVETIPFVRREDLVDDEIINQEPNQEETVVKDKKENLEEIKVPEENNHNPIENQENLDYTQEDKKESDIMENNEVVEVKRGRGRPRKEKTDDGEIIIKSDEQFEEVLARAEKLMRKNEEPLSQSQQKRVEKALKELVDAMKKYKEEN